MADGDYERGRARELDAITAELKRLAAVREGRNLLRPKHDAHVPAPPQSDTKTSQRQDNSKDTDA
jgi:hypothetical protein